MIGPHPCCRHCLHEGGERDHHDLPCDTCAHDSDAYRAGYLAGVAEAERLAALRAAHEQAAHERRERAAYAAGQAAGVGAAP